MKPYTDMAFHPRSEQLVKILCDATGNDNPLFFRIVTGYYFAKIASMMRCNIVMPDESQIPVNMFAINLMTSGGGKGKSTNLIEDKVIDQFQQNFLTTTFPQLTDDALPKLANARAVSASSDPDEELLKVQAEYKLTGELLFSFDKATDPALKQFRHKLLMVEAGSLNLEMDEVGSNITNNMEALHSFLELYDVGKVKTKLVKNTAESQRFKDIIGKTPTNMLLFGTPASLLDGAKTEEEFYLMLLRGYARRCMFCYVRKHEQATRKTSAERLARDKDKSISAFLDTLSDSLGDLADVVHFSKRLQIPDPVMLDVYDYQINCEERSDAMPEHDEMRKAEMTHRHFKALKLAGAYAFVDGSPEITEDHLHYAIKLTEDSGEAFDLMLTRDRPYMKVAKYLASMPYPVTQPDMVEDLPCYRGTASAKAEMLTNAIAYGYKNSIIIKRAFSDGIEFLTGESLQRTDLSKIGVSYSRDIAQGYKADEAPFENLYQMTQSDGIHWCNHGFLNGHRSEDTAIAGFNIIVLDVDGGINQSVAMDLLREYKAMTYTTKRSTEVDNRFRVILPMNFRLELDAADYKEFMNNILQWLPFSVDSQANQRGRKWLSHPGSYQYQDGILLDVLPFIPKTSKNEEFKSRVLDQAGMDHLERWVINNTGDGNRNNMVLRFAMILVDAGFDFNDVLSRVNSLNSKLPDKLSEPEILSTVMTTVGKKIASK